MNVARIEPSHYFTERKVDVHFDNGDIAVVSPNCCTVWAGTTNTAITTDHLLAMAPHLAEIAAHLEGD